jgi:AbrB family looped-hinge helix DNA binding protein
MAKPQRPKHPKTTGFSEDKQEFQSFTPAGNAPAGAGAKNTERVIGKFTVGHGGRVLIPADVRTELGVKEGDVLVASMVDGELRLMSMATAVKRAQAMIRAFIPEGGPSMVDELIAERRRENERDSQ